MGWSNLPAYRLVCDICGRPFTANNPRKKRCSAECERLAYYIQRKKQNERKQAVVKEKKRRMMRDGVAESVREKVLEALKLGVSYGKLQTLKAREQAEHARAKKKKKAAPKGGKKKGC